MSVLKNSRTEQSGRKIAFDVQDYNTMSFR